MRILADENIPDELVDLLREKGHDVSTVKTGAKDVDIALTAKKERRVILTQDKDFANIIWYPPKSLRGIIRIKIHPPVIEEILSRLSDLFNKLTPQQIDKKLVILERDGFRIR